MKDVKTKDRVRDIRLLDRIARAAEAAGKAIAGAFKALAAAISTGGAIAVVVIIVICMISLIAGSAYGIYFSDESVSGGRTLKSVTQEIDDEFWERIEEIKRREIYDELDLSGDTADWREVLAVYAVKVNLDPAGGQEVVTVSEEKIAILKDIFWAMNPVTHEVRTERRTVYEAVMGSDGLVTSKPVEKMVRVLCIRISIRTAEEMAEEYGFTEEQRRMLEEMVQREKVVGGVA